MNVIITEQDTALKSVMSTALTRTGHQVRHAPSASVLWQWLGDGDGDVAVLDSSLPDASVADLVPKLRSLRPELVIYVTGPAGLSLDLDDTQIIEKPFEVNQLIEVISSGVSTDKEGKGVAERPSSDRSYVLAGVSDAIENVRRRVTSYAANTLPVVITGETGTGKSLVAQMLHQQSPRAAQPVISVNCAALNPSDAAKLLFGEMDGAGPGRPGQIAAAASGSLYLKEISQLSDDVQARLLKYLEDRDDNDVGGVRFIVSSRRDPVLAMEAGMLREDLFYRLNVMSIFVPPLRERAEDIPALVLSILDAMRVPSPPTVTQAALDRLMRHKWPGNVRELENTLQRLVLIANGDDIDRDMVEADFMQNGSAQVLSDRPAVAETLSDAVERHLQDYFDLHTDVLPSGGLYHRVLRELERPLLRLTLEATRGNQLKASDVLGLNRNTLRKKIRDLNIQVTRGGRSRH